MDTNLISGMQYNIGHICTRQQCELGLTDKVAMRWLTPALERVDYTFGELEAESNRVANTLTALGIKPGARLFIFLPKCPEVFFCLLGALKVQAITCVLFSNFGEEALMDRLGDAGAQLIITKKSMFNRVKAIWSRLPELQTVMLTDLDQHESAQLQSYPQWMKAASPDFNAPLTPPETPSVLHYTSGSTGKPKGVLHTHRSVILQNATSVEVLGLRPDDVYWCTADQAWVTGVSYGVVGPWSLGVTQVHFGGAFDPETWFSILEQQSVNVWYSAPTALRMLMRYEDEIFQRFDLSALRQISSVGEPLNPEIIYWSRRVLGKEIYDTWFQTETGCIMITNRPEIAIKPGSMGKPIAEIEVGLLDDEGKPVPDLAHGNLCLKPGWPSMFITYWNNETAYQSKFKGGFYYSGDVAYRDSDGYYWFVGRSDDVINTAGHLVSPFEVESALLEIPEVAEAGVIGAPDEILFEKVVAYVVLKPPAVWSPQLDLKMKKFVSNRVSTIAAPKEIQVISALPKNKSGKIMRRVLKARYSGTEAGDLSTLEEF
jgi:acetyl-CoA synthetase